MIIRFPLALVCGLTAYLIAVAMTTYDGGLSLILQPLIGLTLSAAASVGLTVLGCPLLLPRVWPYWRRAWLVPAMIAAVGIGAMVLSWHPDLRVMMQHPETGVAVESFHPGLALGGWAAVLFGILYQPRLAITGEGRWL